MDWMPTLAGICGGEVPQDRIIDGKDIRSLIFGNDGAKSPHHVFYYYKLGTLECVRAGDWKLKLASHQKNKNFQPQLYNLDGDIGETKNVIADHADVVAKLTALAEKARVDLGDNDQPGQNQRKAGWVEDARGLTDPEESK